MSLTKRAVDAVKYPYGADSKKPFVLWDGELAGFGLRVYPSGKKSFILSYRSAGRKRLKTIGRYGALTVQEARKRASKDRVAVDDGRDPVQEARLERDRSKTIRQLGEDYMSTLDAKPATIEAYQRHLDKHIYPRLGALMPAAVMVDDIKKFKRGMKDDPIACNRCLFLVGKILAIAERKGLRSGPNPARPPQRGDTESGVKRYPEPPRKRWLKGEELTRLGEALRELEGAGVEIDGQTRTISRQSAAAIRLLLFTGARKSEILTLRWEDIDLDNGTATLLDHKTATTASGDEPKVVRLPVPAIEILEGVPMTEGDPWVFPGRRVGTHMTDLKRPWNWARKAAGLEGVRVHDLRHTHGSWGATGGNSLLIIGELLGHKQARTTQRYAHLQDDAVVQASESIGGAIAAAMNGEQAEVIDISEAGRGTSTR